MLVRRPAVLLLIPKSAMINGVIGPMANMLSEDEKARNPIRPAIT